MFFTGVTLSFRATKLGACSTVLFQRNVNILQQNTSASFYVVIKNDAKNERKLKIASQVSGLQQLIYRQFSQ